MTLDPRDRDTRQLLHKAAAWEPDRPVPEGLALRTLARLRETRAGVRRPIWPWLAGVGLSAPAVAAAAFVLISARPSAVPGQLTRESPAVIAAPPKPRTDPDLRLAAGAPTVSGPERVGPGEGVARQARPGQRTRPSSARRQLGSRLLAAGWSEEREVRNVGTILTPRWVLAPDPDSDGWVAAPGLVELRAGGGPIEGAAAGNGVNIPVSYGPGEGR